MSRRSAGPGGAEPRPSLGRRLSCRAAPASCAAGEPGSPLASRFRPGERRRPSRRPELPAPRAPRIPPAGTAAAPGMARLGWGGVRWDGMGGRGVRAVGGDRCRSEFPFGHGRVDHRVKCVCENIKGIKPVFMCDKYCDLLRGWSWALPTGAKQ